VVEEPPSTGFYQAPVLLRDVPVTHRLAQDEVFGPVLAAMAFDDEDEAVRSPTARPTAWSPASGRATARASCASRAGARRPGVHQQLRRRRRRGAAVRRREASGHGREKGFEALYGFTTLKTVAIRHG
jgi:aldehyde dehydrogenase (NAD+)